MSMKRDEKAMAWLYGGQEAPSDPSGSTFLQQSKEGESSGSESTIKNHKKNSSVDGPFSSQEWRTSSWETKQLGDDVQATAPAMLEDIRHQIAPENMMIRHEGRITQLGKDEKHQDEVLESEDFRSKFILGWREKVPVSKAVDMTARNVLRCSSCDIDTESGAYLKKVSHPVTKRDQGEYQECSAAQRMHRDTWTSRTRVAHYNNRLKAAAKKPQLPEPMAAPEGYVLTDDKKPAVEEEDCVLRPAIAEDMEGVARIYNLEVLNSLRAWDTQQVRVADFVGILNDCQKADLPFIVATRQHADPVGPGLLPSKAAYPECTQHHRHCDAIPHEPETVLGFGFLQHLDGGFGRGKHAGDMSCRLTLYVDPEHRKKHIGSAIIDRILMCMARTHPGNAIEHRWESDGHHPYNDAEMNRMARFLPNRIVVEGLFRGKKDDDYEWFDKKMMAAFRFVNVGHVEGAYSTRRGMRSECFDKFVWLYMSQLHPEANSGDQAEDADPEGEGQE